MKVKDIRIREISFDDNHMVVTKRIGSGTFCDVYGDVGSDDAYIFMDEDRWCPGKEVLASCSPSQYLPNIERLDDLDVASGKRYSVWRTTRSFPLRAAHRTAWAQHKALKWAWEEAVKQVRVRQGLHRGLSSTFGDIVFCVVSENFIEILRHGSLGLDTNLIDAVEDLCNITMNYGEAMWFEFNKSNLGVNSEGQLILQDVIFDRDRVARLRPRH